MIRHCAKKGGQAKNMPHELVVLVELVLKLLVAK